MPWELTFNVGVGAFDLRDFDVEFVTISRFIASAVEGNHWLRKGVENRQVNVLASVASAQKSNIGI